MSLDPLIENFESANSTDDHWNVNPVSNSTWIGGALIGIFISLLFAIFLARKYGSEISRVYATIKVGQTESWDSGKRNEKGQDDRTVDLRIERLGQCHYSIKRSCKTRIWTTFKPFSQFECRIPLQDWKIEDYRKVSGNMSSIDMAANIERYSAIKEPDHGVASKRVRYSETVEVINPKAFGIMLLTEYEKYLKILEEVKFGSQICSEPKPVKGIQKVRLETTHF